MTNTDMFDLHDRIALVTGASRGVGKGVALGLGEAGATVYVTGRTVRGARTQSGLSGNIDDTAEEVDKLGGQGIAVRCDHTKDALVEAVFKWIDSEQDHLDILVNSAWGGYENMFEGREFTWNRPFWQQPLSRWDDMFRSGVRAAYVASSLAARRMIERHNGLIVNISFWSSPKSGNVAYAVAKSATDKMTEYMAAELAEYGVTVISLYPGLVRTERVMQAAEHMDMSNSESPQFIGRAVAALASDPDIMKRTGTVCQAATLAREYGFTDTDGRQPEPLSPEETG